ncbi:hypothetical protein SHJG_6361 [Streptomyces hygroscopicus subsp. jinggangensis 5008]|nr:hypothetical protein SHJG_6361 [Streptomyces hygroscopicus subsp. jinggangensis 5008]AGF65785.1 hypothetical protein SHJGH_6122 [Streptomyces hygroscopicus subsp. jinggangensis TL01]
MPSHVCPVPKCTGHRSRIERPSTERVRAITRKRGNGSSDYWARWGTSSRPARHAPVCPDRLAHRTNDVFRDVRFR